MSSPAFCNLCNRNVVPVKQFNWILFIFLCGLFYLPFYLMSSKKCPICQGTAFGPASADKIGAPVDGHSSINISTIIDPATKTQANAAQQTTPAAGTPKAVVKFCTECGAAVTPESVFCESCGTKR